MLRPPLGLPEFDGGPLVPVATYLLTIAALSGLVAVSPGASPPPVLGLAWAGFLVVLTAAALRAEAVRLRPLLPPLQTLVPIVGVVAAFWALYNLVAVALALGQVPGFETTLSRTATHPLLYLGAVLSSLLFTAVPEELLFRTYLQQKVTTLAGGATRRGVLSGIALVAVLFALFHLPRWFLASGHGVGTPLAGRLLGLALMGLAYGSVYALTGNLWLVALFHASMNYPPFVVAVTVPSELHLAAAVVEYAVMVSLVYLAVRLSGDHEPSLAWSRKGTSPLSGD
ncbi:CPBP family intramembrane metalloprotease [Haloarcula rubripromontorii]|uniref:CPBP family intramembrane metalloprotease n=1 Tax=Haloarcula rubripromontorii TaxID=1705562 RepID=A0A847TNL5_9EURY|nr:CPBP family intramembrane glutamic endopeptidase [Haloarcula rubripromontorii]NLV04663.1 CPBP family intramembrane metalloprotease [Haloarcula rubripromontorii]